MAKICSQLNMLAVLGFTLVCISISVFIFLQKESSFSNLAPYFYMNSWQTKASIFSFQSYLINDDNETVDFKVLLSLRKRLSPLASITQRLEFADPPLNKTQRNIVYQTGTGLEKITYKNVTTWREFGVTYIPINFINATRTEIGKSFLADYEPYVAYDQDMFFERRKHEKVPDAERKIILARLAVLDPIAGLEPLKACPEFPCVQTTNTEKYYQNASAITFDGCWRGITDESLAPKRRPDQIFILYFLEPMRPLPVLSRKGAGWTDAFNWTMSYHADADILMTYGMVRKRPTPIFKDYSSILSHKTQFIAAFISNCNSLGKRHEYIRQLQQYASVHVYGGCGSYKCQRRDDLNCFTTVSRDYKFYLAFENAICSDYITEKLFKNLKADTVMVVRGPSTYYRHLPEGIYINTQDYKSPKDLAEYLKYLDHNDNDYLNILRKKDQFFAGYESYPHYVGGTTWIKYNWENVPLCEVCQRLWNIDLYSQVYPDIGKWYQERQCREPTDL